MSREARKREILLQLTCLQREYQRRAEPLIKEMMKIKACEPPPPIVTSDGKVFQYTGPLPEWRE